MLKILPIIPSRTSQNFDPLFLFYSHIITYVLFLLILVIFIASVITMSTIHSVTTEQDILPVQSFLQNPAT